MIKKDNDSNNNKKKINTFLTYSLVFKNHKDFTRVEKTFQFQF